jgi:signal transduction histidine kinase
VNVDFDIVLSQALSLFDEVIALRAISLSVKLLPCRQVIDAGLADILVNNLIKNAVKHNVANGFINVELTEKHLVIANSGQPYSGDPAQLMERFAKGKDGNLGIGLAIVKQICDLHGYKIAYSISEKSIHQIQIIFG